MSAVAVSRAADAIEHLPPSLTPFPTIPVGYDVAVTDTGTVVVFDLLSTDPLVDGGFYCIEHQTPRAMSPLPDSRRTIHREVVKVTLSKKRTDDGRELWFSRRSTSRRPGSMLGVVNFGASDGPYLDWQLTDKLLGPIVGIYQPAEQVLS